MKSELFASKSKLPDNIPKLCTEKELIFAVLLPAITNALPLGWFVLINPLLVKFPSRRKSVNAEGFPICTHVSPVIEP